MSTHNGKEPPLDPELVSAFYDGETTPEERAAVELSMDEVGETLQTLDEYDQLSQSLKALHRSHRAGDLRSGVMAQISPLATPVSTAGHRKPGRMFSVIAGLTGLAAAVTLLMWPQSRFDAENAVAINDSVAHDDSLLAPRGASLEELHSAGGVGGRAVDASATLPPPAAQPADLPTRMAEMEASIDGSLAAITRKTPLPAVGEVMGYLDRNADELTWVAVTVVDVQEAGDQVQLLLARHGVPAPDPEARALQETSDPDNLVTFLVEAEWDQMEAVIVDLSDAKFVNALKVDAPADKSVPRELQGYAITRADPGTPTANTQAEALKKRVADRQAPAAMAARSATADGALEENNAVQLQLLVRGDDLERIAAQRNLASPETGAAAADTGASAADIDSNGPADSSRIPSTMASQRAKAVIVIQARDPR